MMRAQTPYDRSYWVIPGQLLAGVYYGASDILAEWLEIIVRRKDIAEVGRRLADVCCAEIECA